MIKNPPTKNKKLITYLFFLIIITTIITPTTKADNVPPPILPTTISTNTELSNIVIQENIKTRMEIKQYCDQKIANMIETVKTEGKNIIGQNFAEFDRRLQEAKQKIFIQIIIGTFATILLAQLTHYIIKRKIEKKHPPRATIFKEYPITPTQAGIIQPKPPTEMSTFQSTLTKNPVNQTETAQTPLTPPIPPNHPKELPTFPELQQPILLSPLEKEKIRREQEIVDKRRKEEAEKELQKIIDTHNKNRKKHQKLMKKLSKPEEEARRMQTEHEELEKKMQTISEEHNIKIPQRTNINNI